MNIFDVGPRTTKGPCAFSNQEELVQHILAHKINDRVHAFLISHLSILGINVFFINFGLKGGLVLSSLLA